MWRNSTGSDGQTCAFTSKRDDSFIILRNTQNTNGYGVVCNGDVIVPMSYYDITKEGRHYTMTPNTALSGIIQYIEF
jgi:hypothetical protein